MKKQISLALGLLSSAALAAEKPNIVIIFADDLGYGDLSCYGATKLKTPNIDKLAAEGRQFTDAHSASAACTPSRYALLTGEYPHRKGHNRPIFLEHKLIIDTKADTVASVLQDAGYSTACIGKWHLGFGETKADYNSALKPGPLEVGFDYFYGLPVVNSHPPFVYVENHHVVGLDPKDPFVKGKKSISKEMPEKMQIEKIGGAEAAHSLYKDEYVGTKLTEKAVEWIDQQGEDPFFLYFATTNIHHPFTPHPQFVGTSECGAYGDFVHELDWMVGEVVKALEKKGVADNTLIFFTSDNGGMINETAQEAWKMGHEQNGELFGFKFSAWEGGHRVPFIAKWPGKIEAGTISDQLICNVDFLATFAAITEQNIGSDRLADSVDILPSLIRNPTQQIRKNLVLGASSGGHLTLRKGDYVYIPNKGGGGFKSPKLGSHGFGGAAAAQFANNINSDMENGKIKTDAPDTQLYNLKNDLKQTTNIVKEFPEIAAEMEKELDTYRKKKK